MEPKKEIQDQGAPPSYDTLFGKFTQVKLDSGNSVEFASRSCGLMYASVVLGTRAKCTHEQSKNVPLSPYLGTMMFKDNFCIPCSSSQMLDQGTSSLVGCTVCLLILLAIPLANIIIGTYYLHQCPIDRRIPIFLIVFGVFSIAQDIFILLKKISKRNNSEENEHGPSPITSVFNCSVGCFIFAWFIAGNVWIYSKHDQFNSNPLSPDYCHPILYYYAFWMLTSAYILIIGSCGIVAVGECVMLCIARGSADIDQNIP